MRRTAVVLISGLALFVAAGCSDGDGSSCRAIYCDDSGCHACDVDTCFCWDIHNTPCGDGCAANEVCTPENVCARACQFDANCLEGERCLPEGYCGPADPPDLHCASDDDCGQGLICEPDGEGGMTCQPAECVTDEDCDPGYVCAECGRCVEEGAHCGDTKTYCETSADCGTGRQCDEFGKCIYECVDDSNCPYGLVCGEDNLCADATSGDHPDSCTTKYECADMLEQCQDLACECINTYCHPHCVTNEDCGPLELCQMSADGTIGTCMPNYRP